MGQSFHEEFSDLLLLKMLRSATEAAKDRDKVGVRGGRVELCHGVVNSCIVVTRKKRRGGDVTGYFGAFCPSDGELQLSILS